jgi:hypothetical protein
MRFKAMVIRNPRVIPDPPGEFFMREGALWVGHQVSEEFELCLRDVQCFASHHHAMFSDLHFDIAIHKPGLRLIRGRMVKTQGNLRCENTWPDGLVPDIAHPNRDQAQLIKFRE